MNENTELSIYHREDSLKTKIKRHLPPLNARDRVANQIRDYRKTDRDENESENVGYITNRPAYKYFFELFGFDNFLDYVAKNSKSLKSNIVMGIGEGKADAINTIAKVKRFSKLKFVATSLTKTATDSKVPILITGVETLDDVENSSVAAIFSVYGAQYSKAPDLAVKRMDEVLVPGGVVKIVFNGGFITELVGLHRYNKFTSVFKKLGYDMAPIMTTRRGNPRYVFLAKKPGGKSLETASELMQKDYVVWKKQYP